LIAFSVVAPSFKAGDLIKLLGVGSVAIAFAFQNILQNFLAGILLLPQEPFQLGDLIRVTGNEGNAHDIRARATVTATKEDRRVVVPNAILFTSPVAVESTAAKTLSNFSVAVSCRELRNLAEGSRGELLLIGC
jgi:small conductance mechanosensitive channel